MQVPEKVRFICNTLKRAGFEAWLVGGSVRDFLLGKEAHDFDLATNARPELISGLFSHVIETGIQHGTVTVMIEGEGFEVTTYRGEGTYLDGRHPDNVTFLNSIEEDLARRDFTMNAIAYDPLKDTFCDPFDGIEDIRAKIIRAVGIPRDRFQEDGLRVMRAIRFISTLGFSIEYNTFDGIMHSDSLASLAKVSVERVHDELFKIMSSLCPSHAMDAMGDTGVLGVILPEMLPMIGYPQNRYHSYDVWTHTMVTLDHCPADNPILRFGALFHDVSKPEVRGVHPVHGDATFYDHEHVGAKKTDEILTRLRFSTEDREKIVHLVRHHFIRYERGWAAPVLRRWVRKVGLENVSILCTLARADIAGKGPIATVGMEVSVIDDLESRVANMKLTEVLPTSTKVLAINGNDVMTHLGLTPGPSVGKVLAALLEFVTDDPECNTREKLLELASEVQL
jgi:tRNA nucleotidyltransferase (CCA-adding enzyme)